MLEEHEHKHAVHEFDGIIENRVASPPVYYTILFYGLVIWGVAFCAFFLLSGWSSEEEFNVKMSDYQQQHMGSGQPDGGGQADAAAPAIAETDAASLYGQHCAMCHGDEAEGGVGPALTAAEYVYGKAPDEIIASIAGGRPNGMPGFESKLSQQEIAALADYLLALSGPEDEQQAEPGTAGEDSAGSAEEEAAAESPSVDAAALYSQHCAMCHGADGKGGIGPDMTDPNYIYGKSQDKVVDSITNGRPNGMPAFNSKLSETEISALAEHVRAL